ncbi:uncharacterized protein LOC118349887 [Juglans regia]|uniref:Uncharacterized protein LOC118349887 n=1 Tax=Juglans regia TaxID=51240 RepID=A0A6P9EVR2_JUGRE|nr:uncharacterized protein LOC118349887 [Juglans regia]
MGGEPCFFAGDFNVIRSDIERCGGRPRNRVAIDEFNKWIHQGGLLEMNSQGGKFTWCNGQQGLSRAWAKLDRVLLDANFLSLFPTAHCLYLPRTTSDHCPMVIEFLSDPFSYGPPPFRFQQMWVEHPDFMTLVQTIWSESVIGSGLFKLATKLKKLKVALRVWNKSVFGRTNTQIAILEDKIENLENLLQRGWDADIERELVRTSNELSSWRIREDIRLAQMAKIKWRMGGDRNTKFFHVWLSNKKHRKIHQLRTSNGLEFNSPEAIHLGAVDYFSDFLQRSNPVREVPDLSSLISSVINDEDCVRLCGIPSLVEVKEALSTIPINSSPAFDTAVADRVDFISLSVGVVFLPYYLDAIAIAAFRAYDFGVFVSASAGNGGPGGLSVTNISPWVTTVGAGTIDRDFPADVKLGNGKIIPGVSVYGWPALTRRGRGRDEGESPC